MKTRIIRWIKILLGLSLVGFLTLFLLYRHYVLQNPGEHISNSSIDAILTLDTRIYYSDGQSPIGNVFDERHRFSRIEFDQLPKEWVDAIVAAEDQRYFSHYGLDPIGILRAVKQNIIAGRIVSGASTLTQQTAKNLYYRTDRDFRSKAEEALNSLRLEAHYSKEEILAFYANQVHVRGNGRGLGVAARYFFDKEVSELGLLECAFLAGMVKGPDNYNPFIGDVARQQRGLDRARTRVDYVIGRMNTLGFIDDSTYQKALETEIPFKNGSFRFASNVVVDSVEQQLNEEPFASLLEQHDIQNLSTAGLRIVTTIDEKAQRYAWYGLRHHLSDIGASFEGADAEHLIQRDISDLSRLQRQPPVGSILYGQVSEKDEDSLTLNMGGYFCTVDKDGLQRMADILARAEKGVRKKGKVGSLLGEIAVDNIVIASVRDENSCDLELNVDLNGAVLAIQKGQIRVMVGGVSNRDLNRATMSKRQLGSTWKSIIYSASLQLGWSPTDMLDNRQNGFLFERVWYSPGKAHRAEDVVSMTWAGVNSENLASVWLLVHLTDQLSPIQLQQVVEQLRLDPQEEESRNMYIERIRDSLGVISTDRWRPEVAFLAAKREWLMTAADDREKLEVQTLQYGRSVDKLLKSSRNEVLNRNVSLHFQYLYETANSCAEVIKEVQLWNFDDLNQCIGDCILSDLVPIGYSDSGGIVCGDALSQKVTEADYFQLAFALKQSEVSVSIEERISLNTIQKLGRSIEKHSLLMEVLDPYDIDFLIHHPDFQQVINMRYVSLLAERLGIKDELKLTLSMPLGALDITLQEGVNLYSGVLTGKRYIDTKLQSERPTLIQQIVLETGEEIYSANLEAQPVSDEVSGHLTAQILHNVVQHGTGRRAKNNIHIGDYSVPAFGKTGTTNGFKNAAFLGVVPSEYGGAWSLDKGVFIGVYVGYDEPKPMKRGSMRGGGSNAALPIWILTAQGAAEAGLLGELDKDVEWKTYGHFFEVPIEKKSGLPHPDGEAQAWIYDPELIWGIEATHARRFAPVQFDSPPLQQPLRQEEASEDVVVRILDVEEIEDVVEEADIIPLLFPSGEE